MLSLVQITALGIGPESLDVDLASAVVHDPLRHLPVRVASFGVGDEHEQLVRVPLAELLVLGVAHAGILDGVYQHDVPALSHRQLAAQFLYRHLVKQDQLAAHLHHVHVLEGTL